MVVHLTIIILPKCKLVCLVTYINFHVIDYRNVSFSFALFPPPFFFFKKVKIYPDKMRHNNIVPIVYTKLFVKNILACIFVVLLKFGT